jgi:transmembrane sensor
MNQEIFRHLLYQYITGELSAEDRILLNDLLKRPEYNQVLNEFVAEFMESNDWEGEDNPAIGAAIHQYLDQWINASVERAPVLSLLPPIHETQSIQPTGALVPQNTRLIPIRRKKTIRAIAAVFVLLAGIGIGTISLQRHNKSTSPANTNIATRYKNDLPPGVNGAILTLANGQYIVLDSAGNGTLAVQGNTRLINHNGQIIYAGESKSSQELLYNTMTTPKGRQYQLMLADGTKVWLNASSSIRFPTAFTGKERKVEITGEAYFEVAPPAGGHEKTPFRVHIDPSSGGEGIDIEVLGTHFNVNAYSEEATVQTTLLEGAVKVSMGNDGTILRPGQQARINQSGGPSGNINVLSDVDMDVVMGWKNGYFSFHHTDLRAVMRQIARWYDVDITYTGKVPDRRFGGEISRNSNASEVLKILEESKVYFRIEGKKIFVLPEQESQKPQTGQ